MPIPKRAVWIVAGVAGAFVLAMSCACAGGGIFYFFRPASLDPAFDANNLERTAAWAAAASSRAQAVQGNQIALDDYTNKLTTECRQHVGKKVAWSIPVESVTQGSVELKSRWCGGPVNMMGQATSPTLTLLKVGGPVPTWQGIVLPLTIGDEIPRERAGKLQPNAAVRVRGTVRSIDVRLYDMTNGQKAIDVQIVLDDLHAE